jgi:hypothetical protein
MSFLRAHQANQPWIYEYTGQQIQVSTAGVPIPLVYGTNKVSFNQIWQDGFYAVPDQTSSSGGSGGKGGSHPTTSGYFYYTAAILALCEGPIEGLGLVWYGTDTNLINFGYDLFLGTTPQTPWSFLTANYSSEALSYGGVAYMAAPSWYLGSGASFPSVQVEVKGVLSNIAPVNGVDADPALVIQDFLTNSQYGVGFPPGSIDATTLLILSQAVSISAATPAVITWAGAPPENGTPFTFTTGSVPTGLALNTVYYVVDGNSSAGTSELAASASGAPIATTGSAGSATAVTQDSYQTYCQASGLALSPTIINQETGSSILTRWLQLTNSAAVWSGGKLKFIPYGDLPVTGNLHAGGTITFTPNTAPVYDLDDDDYVHDGDNDPILISRVDPFTVKNWLALTISQRTVQYSDVPIEAWNQNNIEQTRQIRKGPQITAHEICDPAVGQIAVQLILQRGLGVRNTYQFKLSFEYCLLEPMDLITVTDAGLGLNQLAVRITAVEEDDAGLLSVTAEDFPIGSATATVYLAPTSNGVGYDSNVTADPVNPPIIFEPPAALTGNVTQIWAAVSGGSGGTADPNWGGASVYVSLDDATYIYIGNTGGPARQGVLSGSLPAFSGANPDTVDTLSVSMAESAGALSTVSATAAATFSTLSIVDDELIAFETATLTGANAYNITTLYRGLYGSTPASHSGAAPFARLDNLIFKYDLPSQYIGVPLYFKFQSFNLWGQGIEELSTCAVYDFTPTGSGSVGPVSTALLAGSNLDYGDAALSVNETDDWGLASDPYTTTIDLGLASA